MTPQILRKMNWWCELPKLDLTTALQIKGASGELLQLKGQGFSWTKPSTATSIFSLATPQAGKSGFNVSSQTDTSIVLDRTTSNRSWISWAVSWPVGSRIVFDWQTANSATGVWCAMDDAIGLGSPAYYVLQNVSGGSGHADYTIPGTGWSYFGWFVNNGQATGLLTITNFAVYAP